MYSRTHCLMVMPMSAEKRAHTRLENQRALMRILDGVGWYAGLLELLGRVPAPVVAFAIKRDPVAPIRMAGRRSYWLGMGDDT